MAEPSRTLRPLKASPTSNPLPTHKTVLEMFEKKALWPCGFKDTSIWPELELTNATVAKQRGGELHDLLDVEDHGPFQVRGTLSRIPNNYKKLIRFSPPEAIYNHPFVVTQVIVNSVQSFPDGTIKIWALGASAWYSIRPAPEYRAIFDITVEKARLWHFLQDEYDEEEEGEGERGEEKRDAPNTVNELYTRYAETESTCPNKRTATEWFDKHHRYLFRRMCCDLEKWERTPLFRYYKSKYSDELEGILALVTGVETTEMVGSALVNQDTAASSASPRIIKRPKVPRNAPSRRIFKRLREYVSTHKIKQTAVTKDWMARCLNEIEFSESYQLAVETVDANAQDMLSLLEEFARSSATFNWIDTPAYRELMAPKSTGKLVKTETRGRINVDHEIEEMVVVGGPPPTHMPLAETPIKTSTKTFVTPMDIDSDSENENQRRRRSVKGTSSLRPSFTKAPIEVPSPSRSTDDGDFKIDEISSALPLNRKRALDDLLSPIFDDSITKRRTRAHVPSLSVSTARAGATNPVTPGMKPGPNRAPTSSIRSHTVGPNQPGGHWECEIDGCKHSILDAGKNLELIEQHYEEHGRIMKQAMDAIGGELLPNRPKHHVDNLLAKIEEMAKKWALSKPAPLAALELGLATPLAPSSSSAL